MIKTFENNSQSQFAKKIGCPQTTLNGYLNEIGQEKIKFSFLEKILETYPTIRKEWLFFGQEPLVSNEVEEKFSDEDFKRLQAENEQLKQELAEADRLNRKLTARYFLGGDSTEDSGANMKKAAEGK